MPLGETTVRGYIVEVSHNIDSSTMYVGGGEIRLALEFNHDDFELVEPERFTEGTRVEVRYLPHSVPDDRPGGRPLGQALWFDKEAGWQELAYEVDQLARPEDLGRDSWSQWTAKPVDTPSGDLTNASVWTISTRAISERQAEWEAEQLQDALDDWMQKHPGDEGMYEIVQDTHEPLLFLPQDERVFISPDREDVSYWVSPYGHGAFPSGPEATADKGTDWRQNWVLSPGQADVKVIGDSGRVLGGAQLRPVPKGEGWEARALYEDGYFRKGVEKILDEADKSVSPATSEVPSRTDATTAGAPAQAERKERVMAQENGNRIQRGDREGLGDTTVRGNLVDDPRRVTTKANKPMVVARLADTPRVYDREMQEWKDGATTYYDVAIDAEKRPQLAANVESSLRKGHDVVMSGRHSVEPYIGNDGEPKIGHRLWADNVSASLAWTPVEIPVKDRGAERGLDVDPVDHALEQNAHANAPSTGWEGPAR